MHRSLPAVVVALSLALSACERKPRPSSNTAGKGSVGLARAAASSSAAPAPSGWIEDDYPRALAAARAAKLPLFVDAAAVWCHTCLAMRAYVLDQPALDKSGFVWFSFDVERHENGAVAARYAAKSLPTFFIVDPVDESVHGRWEGAATLDQIREFMKDGRRSIELARAGGLPPDDPLALLLAGHRAALEQHHEQAERSFERALAAAPPGWSRRADALEALLVARRRGGRAAACFELGRETFAKDAPGVLGRSSLLTDFAAVALGCAGDASVSEHDQRALAQRVAQTLGAVARDAEAPLSPDDRSDAWRVVWDAYELVGERERARAAARARLAVIEDAVRRAPGPSVATAFDGARLETLVYLDRAAEAVEFLQKRERELPNDYNPPHRLAVALEALGRHGEALSAIDRALAKGFGLRKLRLYFKRADIVQALGRRDEARRTLEAALAHLRTLPEPQRKPELEAKTEARLAELAR